MPIVPTARRLGVDSEAYDRTAEFGCRLALRQVYGDVQDGSEFALVRTESGPPSESGAFIVDGRAAREPDDSGLVVSDLLIVSGCGGVRVNGRRKSRAFLQRGDVVRTSTALYVCMQGDPMLELRRRAELVASSNLALLILGETGTGKEVLARTIHRASERPGAFVAINCAVIPRELLATELFGHVRGAFSGAVRARKGWVLSAEHGTLLLDEVGEMPPECQPSLLRLVENHAVAPLGCDRELPVDVRIVAATNRALDTEEVSLFRPDLYARLAQVVLRVPPLRERQAEILRLAHETASEFGSPLRFDIDAAEAMLRYRWPHNVRELKSVVSALGVFAGGASTVAMQHLREVKPEMFTQVVDGLTEKGAGSSGTMPRTNGGSRLVLHDPDALAEHLLLAQGNVAELARQLKTSRAHVYRWLRRWGLRAG